MFSEQSDKEIEMLQKQQKACLYIRTFNEIAQILLTLTKETTVGTSWRAIMLRVYLCHNNLLTINNLLPISKPIVQLTLVNSSYELLPNCINYYLNYETGFLNITPLSILTKMPVGDKLISAPANSQCGALSSLSSPSQLKTNGRARRTRHKSLQKAACLATCRVLHRIYSWCMDLLPSAARSTDCRTRIDQDGSMLRHEAAFILLDMSLQLSAREMPLRIRT